MTDDDYIVTINKIEIAQVVFASISLLCSVSVIFILLYYYHKLYYGKLFSHYILIIAICDSITSFSFALGYPKDWLCSIQGFLLIFFARMSWFYTVCLTINLCVHVKNLGVNVFHSAIDLIESLQDGKFSGRWIRRHTHQ
jgi:hypothetical protein